MLYVIMDIISKTIKTKRLQVLGHAQCLIIPKKWIDALGWNKTTNLKLMLHPEGEIVIIKSEIQNEEVSDIEPAGN